MFVELICSRWELTKALQLKLDLTSVSETSHRPANTMLSHSTNLYAFISCKLHSGRAYHDVFWNSGRLIELPTGVSFPYGSVQIRLWRQGIGRWAYRARESARFRRKPFLRLTNIFTLISASVLLSSVILSFSFKDMVFVIHVRGA